MVNAASISNEDLWDAIQAHRLPADGMGRSFLRQLREKRRLTCNAATRAIEEYRRFVYIAVVGGRRPVPSATVEAVWSLHLSHTRDYWQVFVPRTLGGRVVDPDLDGLGRYRYDFSDTIRLYRREFGEVPPEGIWKRHARRFARTC